MKPPVIIACAWCDQHPQMKATFDAVSWFEHAQDADILRLMRDHYTGEVGEDILDFFLGEETCPMLDELNALFLWAAESTEGDGKQEITLSCQVHPESAARWLSVHNRELCEYIGELAQKIAQEQEQAKHERVAARTKRIRPYQGEQRRPRKQA